MDVAEILNEVDDPFVVSPAVRYGVLGMSYFTMGKYDSARIYLRRSLAMPGGREYQGGRFIANLANTYGFEGRYAEAMKHYMDALEVAENLIATGRDIPEGETNIIRVGANLSEILYTIGNHERALHYALMAKSLLDAGHISAGYIYHVGARFGISRAGGSG